MQKKHQPITSSEKIARLASFTELNPRPVIEIETNGRIIYANASAKATFPDMVKKGPKHAYLSDLPKIVRVLKKKGEKSFSREIQIGEKWFRHFFYYLPDSKSIVIYGLDITNQKIDQERLKEGESRYHMLFEKMNYGYALQDIIFNKKGKPVDYRFIDVNPAFEKLSEMKKEFIIGKTVNTISTRPKTAENVKAREQYDNVAITGEPMYMESYNEKTKKYFELYAYRPNKNQLAMIFSDITNRKKTDEEKNNFIAIMSHELRNPLTPIMANAQFTGLMLARQKNADPVMKESVEIIEKQAKIMADLLNDILDVSRLSRHKIQLEKTRLNICDAIESSIKTSMPFINSKHQEISVVFAREEIWALADPLRMEQIMVNIINNASKYTQPGGSIMVSCGLENGRIEIKVKDNGIGMNAGKMKRIFELFSDESQPFMGIGGLGIGLNIVKNLVSMHKGTISVASKGKSKGSEFIISLPASKQEKRAKTPAPVNKKLAAAGNSKSKVLIVDDNEDICSAISNILQQEGYQTQTSHDGAHAVAAFKTFKPETALIDIGLPDISGYNVAEIMRKQQQGKIKLIAFSGYGQERDKKLSKEAGFDHHLTKPVDITELIKLIA